MDNSVLETSYLEKIKKLSFVSLIKNDVNWKRSFFLGTIIGATIFIGIYGVMPLDFTNDNYIYHYAPDLVCSHLGWRLYRESSWHFPIGLCDTSMYPSLTSVIYTDSIPILCVFFKILSPILPKHFQFLGIYGLICYMLQGGVAKLLLRKTIKGELLRNLAAIPFVLNIVLANRMFYHTSLSSQYLLLLGMLLYVRKKDISARKRYVFWMLLGSLSILIHFYLYAMVSVMFLGMQIIDSIEYNDGIKKGIAIHLVKLICYLFFSVFLFWLFGGFYGGVASESDGLGMYSANINSLINSIGYSKILPAFSYFEGQEEGLCYLGISIIILFLLSFPKFIQALKKNWKQTKVTFLVVSILIILLWIFSLSPRITAGELCFEYTNYLPEFVINFWSIFRATGRFMWVIQYLIIWIACSYMPQIKTGILIIIVLVLCTIQVYEYSDYFKAIHGYFIDDTAVNFSADSLYSIDVKECKHIMFLTEYEKHEYYNWEECYNTLVGYTRFAVDNNLTVSRFHYSRYYGDKIKQNIQNKLSELRDGKYDPETIYVISKTDIENLQISVLPAGLLAYDVGENIVLIPSKK